MNSYIPSRKAILIGSPGSSPYLRGVQRDISGVNAHVQSYRGGHFYPREVKILNTPSADQLFDEIEKSVVDYLFIYYSGHGCLDESGNTLLAINENEIIPDFSLFNDSRRQLIITDTCRIILPAAIGGVGVEDYF